MTSVKGSCSFAKNHISNIKMNGHSQRDLCTVSICGEIYNLGEIAPGNISLEEAIAELYLTHGISFVSLLNGIFAIAIYDHRKNTLCLIRDRVGAKPLFYSTNGKMLVFASHPNEIFSHAGFRPQLTAEGLAEILAIGPARTPGFGVFKNLYEVIPGHIISISDAGISDTVYWDLKAAPHTDDYAETVDAVSFLVRDAVKRQCDSPNKLCSFLSGGIDSSIVTSIASDYMSERGKALPTFSFDFTGNDVYFKSNAFQPERDLPYVLKMADYCRSDHSILECDEATLVTLLPDVVAARDLPGMADVESSLIYFCSLVAKKKNICLTGECADEVFGGYPWFYRDELLYADTFPWSRDMTARTQLLNDDVIRSLDLSEHAAMRYSDSLKSIPHLDDETPEEYARRNVSYLNIKWFMTTLLERMDRAGTYAGITARVPFADHRLMEYLFNVPWDMKYRNGVEKALLRDACRDLLPEALLTRKKSPYPKTYNPGYEKLLIDQFSYILSDPMSPIAPLIDRRKAKQFMALTKELGRPWFGQLMAGPQLIAYYIQINCWMKKYGLTLP